MSAGIRSGVNCTRRASRPSTMPSVSTSFVLARPGTPTSSPWPPASKRDERLLDDLLLAEDHRADRRAGGGDHAIERDLGIARDGGFERGRVGGGFGHGRLAPWGLTCRRGECRVDCRRCIGLRLWLRTRRREKPAHGNATDSPACPPDRASPPQSVRTKTARAPRRSTSGTRPTAARSTCKHRCRRHLVLRRHADRSARRWCQLFAGILRKDPERYVLVTPVECVGITVEDVPFVAVAMEERAPARCVSCHQPRRRGGGRRPITRCASRRRRTAG